MFSCEICEIFKNTSFEGHLLRLLLLIVLANFQKQPPGVFSEISQNSQENSSARVSFLMKLQAKVCESSKNTFFTEYLRETGFELLQNICERIHI